LDAPAIGSCFGLGAENRRHSVWFCANGYHPYLLAFYRPDAVALTFSQQTSYGYNHCDSLEYG